MKDIPENFKLNTVLSVKQKEVTLEEKSDGAVTKIELDESNECPQTIVYTDGACRGNGKNNCAAGFGVFYGIGDTRNASIPLSSKERHTNQRAELAAIVYALQVALDSTNMDLKSKDLVIRTDSQYSISCFEIWSHQWKESGWKNKHKNDVINRDLIEKGIEIIEKLESTGRTVKLEWVKGHGSCIGNIEADKLAVSAALIALTE